jgi:hypothetical protein
MSGEEARTWLRLIHRRDRLSDMLPKLRPKGNWYKRLKLLRMIERTDNKLRTLDERLTCEGVL